ncbi:MAG: hypothetical protein ABL958_15760 [Bdellovibrionia bacterium]
MRILILIFLVGCGHSAAKSESASQASSGSKTNFEKLSSGVATYKLQTQGCGELTLEVSTDSSFAGRRAELSGRTCDFSGERHRQALAVLLKFSADDTKERPPFSKLNVEKRSGDPSVGKLTASIQKAFVENGFCILSSGSQKSNLLYDVKVKGDCD